MSLTVSDVTVEAGTTKIPIDGGNSTAVKVDGSAVTQPVSGSVSVSNFPATQPVSGSVSVSNFPATQPVSGTVAVTQSTSPWVVSGTVTTTAITSSSDTVTQVTSTGSNQTLLAANANRKKAILYFESGLWSVKYGATASTSSRTYAITGNNTAIEVDIWTGQIDAICTTSGKLVDVTEMV
jgi:hypothetical protein